MRSITAIVICLVIGILCAKGVVAGKKTTGKSRWDEDLAREVAAWYPLLRGYAASPENKAKGWIGKRRELEHAIQHNPNSEYLDDLHLALACGIASYEKDAVAAIRAMERLRNDFPDQGTILFLWTPTWDWTFDYHWLETVPPMVSIRSDGKPRVRPLGMGRKALTARERAALTYFEHLSKHPRLTRDIASLYIAALYRVHGDNDKADITLEALVKDSAAAAIATNKEDRRASSEPDGVWIHGVVRPWVVASSELMVSYVKRKNYNAAIAVGKYAVNAVSEDGWYWELNEHLGDIYKATISGKSPDAAVQYNLAIAGVGDEMRREAAFIKACDGTLENVSTAKWKNVMSRLKRKIVAVGGTVETNGDDLKAAKEVFSTPATVESRPVSLRDEAIQRLRNAYSTKTDDEQTNPKAVDEVVKWWLDTEKHWAAEETVKVRLVIARGLAELAMGECEGIAKKNAVAGVRRILGVQISPKDEDQEKAVAEIAKKLQAAASQKDIARIKALQQELGELPEISVTYVAQWCCDDGIDVELRVLLSDALWNRGTPESLDSVLSSLEKCRDRNISRAITSSIKASIARIGMTVATQPDMPAR